MIFDRPGIISRPSGGESTDSKFKQRVGPERTVPVYDGMFNVQHNTKNIARSGTGDEQDVSDAFIFMPFTEDRPQENDILTLEDGYVGVIRRPVNPGRFYIRFEVNWDATPV